MWEDKTETDKVKTPHFTSIRGGVEILFYLFLVPKTWSIVNEIDYQPNVNT
jgi:hypothetical protein